MKLILIFLFFITIFSININSEAKEKISNEETLKIGLIVPLSGNYKYIGQSILNSLRIALNRINNKKIEIYPRNNEANPKKTLALAKELESLGIKIIIGPIFYENLIYLDELDKMIFLSLTNKIQNIPSNVISAGINVKSQMECIISFLKKKELKKTIFLIPKSEYTSEVQNFLSKTKYNFWKIYLYDTKPDKLTNQIKQITKYSERKKNLEDKINDLKNSNLPNSKNEIEKLMKKDTLGEIDFDSIVIADFDESLKSVTTSFLYSDVSPNKIKFIALNQWFDETLFKENSTNQIYFPSINKKKYNKFRETYFINFNKYPSKISIISYDILGLVYYLAKKNKYKINKNFFVEKNKFIGEIGSFEIKNKILDYKLKLYQVSNNQFIKVD